MTGADRPPIRWCVLAAIAAALWADMLFSVGWTFESCVPIQGTNFGEGSAGYGLPLPYMQWSTSSSLEYHWIPHIFGVNIVILSLLALLLGWRARSWLGTGWRRWIILTLLLFGIALQFLRINAFMVRSVDDFRAGEDRVPVTALRPEGLYFGTGGYDCKPAPFWFAGHRR